MPENAVGVGDGAREGVRFMAVGRDSGAKERAYYALPAGLGHNNRNTLQPHSQNKHSKIAVTRTTLTSHVTILLNDNHHCPRTILC